MKKRPDAIFTISDRMAIGAMLAIKEKGLNMPHDIGLVGFNNEPVTSLVTPGISSVDQPAFELGKIAAKLFIETMHNDGDMSEVEEDVKTKTYSSGNLLNDYSLKTAVLNKYTMHAIADVVPVCFILAVISNATTIVVKNIEELNKANKKAKPGDIIILKNGEWKNVTIKLDCNGTKEKPITFKAQKRRGK